MRAGDGRVFIEQLVGRGGGLGHRPDGHMIRRAVYQHGEVRGNALEQQRLDGLDAAIRMKSLPHDATIQEVIDRHQAHALVMSHVAVDDDAFSAIAFLLTREVKRFIEGHSPIHAELFEALEVLNGGRRIYHQGECGGVGRHDQILFQSALQPERGNAEGSILIDPMRIDRAVGRLRDAPRHIAFVGIFDLSIYGSFAGVIEQRVAKAERKQTRHQVLKHRAAPGQQYLPPQRGIRTTQRQPVVCWHIAFCNGYETT